MVKKDETQGITVKKEENISEWYTQVIQKAELLEYTDVSGCMIYRPRCFEIWEKLKDFFDKEIKKMGVKNAYFPLFIPESLMKKEEEHVEGFAPEVAWVTHGGHHKLNERLAIRPTSETVMYDAYSKWIRSHRDLPLQLNQWVNVVRWEFSHPTPLLRGREFLWQEGHSAFATKEEADKEVTDILELYKRVFEEKLAVPVFKGKKTENEKFAGADYSLSVETLTPSGKAVQAATSHHLGQSFAKSFEISFLDEKGEKSLPFQNSWGFSTRSIGAMILYHGDDKGLVIPPNVAPTQVVIVPILFEDTKEKVLKEAKAIEDSLKNANVSVMLDDRDSYSPGWKFNEWELKGVCLRIEIGPKDIEKSQAVIARRDTGEKQSVALKDVANTVPELLNTIQKDMFTKAKKFLDEKTVHAKTWDEFKEAIEDKKLVIASWCFSEQTAEKIKAETSGAKCLTMPFDMKPEGNCIITGKPATHIGIFAKAY